MKILVAYATRHGATAGIAERIASRLAADGIAAEAHPVADVADVALYDAVVLGGAAYMAHWLKDATAFAKRHRQELQPGRSGSSAAARSETTLLTKTAGMHCEVRGLRSSPNCRHCSSPAVRKCFLVRGTRMLLPSASANAWSGSLRRPGKHCRRVTSAIGMPWTPGLTT